METLEQVRGRKKVWTRDWRAKNPERSKELNRRALIKARETTLRSTDGLRLKVNKRPRPDNICEICGRTGKKKLDYHHWDNEHPEKGIWVCYLCHRLAENIESGLHTVYLQKKEEINNVRL